MKKINILGIIKDYFSQVFISKAMDNIEIADKTTSEKINIECMCGKEYQYTLHYKLLELKEKSSVFKYRFYMALVNILTQ